MDNDTQEIAYYILQNEYLKRKNIKVDETNLKSLDKEFPEYWFLFSITDRVKYLTLALKNNLNLEDVIDSSNKEISK